MIHLRWLFTVPACQVLLASLLHETGVPSIAAVNGMRFNCASRSIGISDALFKPTREAKAVPSTRSANTTARGDQKWARRQWAETSSTRTPHTIDNATIDLIRRQYQKWPRAR